MTPWRPPAFTGRPKALAERHAALLARSQLLRSALDLEVRLLDAQITSRAAQAAKWLAVAQRASGWAALLLPLLLSRASGRRGLGKGLRRLPALLFAGLRAAPLLARAARLLAALRHQPPRS